MDALIQLPILFALYRLFAVGTGFNPNDLYSFVKLPTEVLINFLGLIDMTKSNYVLAVLAGISQFFQMQLAMPKMKKPASGDSFQDHLSRSMSVQARYIMPAFIFFIALKFSSALTLYWTTMNVFAIVHEAIVAYRAKKFEDGRAVGENQKNN